jgi:tripartite-type tricarboxylate transporter receptor subunit TctC
MLSPLVKALALSLLTLALVNFATAAYAQTYPSKPVRMIVPFPPGGTTDLVGRVLAQKLGEQWGQQVLVDNRPGASGIIGSEIAAKAPPDGYTFVMCISAHVVNPSLYAKVPFDAFNDFAPIVLIGMMPNVVVVHPSVPVRSIKELIALARSRPAQLNYASGGKRLSNHLSVERFKKLANIELVHIPFKGGSPAITALLGGQVDLMFNTFVTTLPLIVAGKLRGLAITSIKRSPLMPDLPTVAESGFPGFEASEWLGFLAPAGTPAAIVTKINADVVKALGSPEVQDRLVNQQGFIAVGDSPREFAEFMKSESAKWSKVIKDARITPE